MTYLNDIPIRDPFVLPDDSGYYVYGTTYNPSKPNSFTCYHSQDLVTVDEAKTVFEESDSFWAKKDYWAPEVYRHDGRYYMAATFKADGKSRGTQILVASSPYGPFEPLIEKPITPEGWECLDGSLFFDEDGRNYLYFCREWLEVHDGEMYVMELTKDLKKPLSGPVRLFKAGEVGWSFSIKDEGNFVTDGPFVYKDNGRYRMLWSSFSKQGYAIAFAEASSPFGPFVHAKKPIYNDNGGHPMVFNHKGERYVAFHTPNDPSGKERMKAVPLKTILNGN